MSYTEAQAKLKADQIWKRFSVLIHLACRNSSVPETFLGGFIGVEAGVKHGGQIDPSAKRFERGVFHKLTAVRDGLMHSWSGIKTADLAGMSDDAITNFATSWGLTQIMGWHLVHNLKGTIEDLRDPDKHLTYAVQLLGITAGRYLKAKDFGSVLRIWNSGSANGKTYDPDYVANAMAVKAAYAAIVETHGYESQTNSAVEVPAVSQPDQKPAENSADEPTVAPPIVEAQPPIQNAENITNVSTGDKTVPDNFVPEDKIVNAPAKEGSTQQAAAMTIGGFIVPTFMVGFIAAVKSAITNGFISADQIGSVVINFISGNSKFVLAGLGLVVGGMMLKKLYKQITMWLTMYIAARADMHNVTVKPQ